MNIQSFKLPSMTFQNVSHGLSQGIRHLGEGFLIGSQNAVKIVAPTFAVLILMGKFHGNITDGMHKFRRSLWTKDYTSPETNEKLDAAIKFIYAKHLLIIIPSILTAVCLAKRWPPKTLSVWQTAMHALIAYATYSPTAAKSNWDQVKEVVSIGMVGVTLLQCSVVTLQGLKHLKSHIGA